MSRDRRWKSWKRSLRRKKDKGRTTGPAFSYTQNTNNCSTPTGDTIHHARNPARHQLWLHEPSGLSTSHTHKHGKRQQTSGRNRYFLARRETAGFCLDFFEDGGGGVFARRFMASSKLIPCNRRSMAFGIFGFGLYLLSIYHFSNGIKSKNPKQKGLVDSFGWPLPKPNFRIKPNMLSERIGTMLKQLESRAISGDSEAMKEFEHLLSLYGDKHQSLLRERAKDGDKLFDSSSSIQELLWLSQLPSITNSR